MLVCFERGSQTKRVELARIESNRIESICLFAKVIVVVLVVYRCPKAMLQSNTVASKTALNLLHCSFIYLNPQDRSRR